MVVDDEQDLREMINLMMQKEGFETKMAEDGIDFQVKQRKGHVRKPGRKKDGKTLINRNTANGN